jgi:putative ABC transport system permease protein
VVLQALTLAVAAYALGVVVSCLMYAFLQGQANIPIGMNVERAILVLAASLGMCSLAAWLALGRVKTADPANLF